jgi:hypothetical protein
LLTTSLNAATAQKIDSIYVNLYTDSLKKGTYNYINIDGLLSNGSYLPLDSMQLILTSSAGRFIGNSLWIEKDFAGDKVTIKAVLRNNPKLAKQFDMYIKRKPDNEKLKTADEIIDEINNGRRSKKKSGH